MAGGRSKAGRRGRVVPIALAALLAVALVALAWWGLGGRSSGTAPAEEGPAVAATGTREARTSAPEAEPEPPAEPWGVPAPAQRIADRGRLRVTLEALREGDVLALGLELPDALRGQGPRPVKIVDVSGRKIERLALPVEGEDAGLRLDLEPGWLRPGRYMIEVETEGGGPLPLRRYVLEIVEADAPR